MDLRLDYWDKETYSIFKQFLIDQQDLKYQQFHHNLIADQLTLLGVRTPILKAMAHDISLGNYQSFININEHQTYEEIMIHGFIIGNLKINYHQVKPLIDQWLPYISNWALCDMFCANLKVVKKYRSEFLNDLDTYLNSSNPWYIRYALVILLDHYMLIDYLPLIFRICNNLQSDNYYVKMAVSWLLSICYIKYPSETIKYLNKSSLDDWTFNKTISKIIDSKRCNKDQKAMLNHLKRT